MQDEIDDLRARAEQLASLLAALQSAPASRVFTADPVGGVVDIPNACVSVAIPCEMFEFDIKPNASGPQKHVDSSRADMARAR